MNVWAKPSGTAEGFSKNFSSKVVLYSKKEKALAMWFRLSELLGYSIEAVDGRIGRVGDFLLDDIDWTVQWLVADTGSWLPGRKVLLSPAELGPPDPARRCLPVGLTTQNVRECPGIEKHLPIGRHYEVEMQSCYLWSPTRVEDSPERFRPVHAAGAPGLKAQSRRNPAGRKAGLIASDEHLRSTREILGYRIHATDADIGHCEDFVVEGGAWEIQYLVVETREWGNMREVILLPSVIKEVDWQDRRIVVRMTSAQVKAGPEFGLPRGMAPP
jgi:hypothetical protein